jgi:hypothetical protein
MDDNVAASAQTMFGELMESPLTIANSARDFWN